MKVALTVWNGRISPVFDVSRKILILDVSHGVVTGQREEPLEGIDPAQNDRWPACSPLTAYGRFPLLPVTRRRSSKRISRGSCRIEAWPCRDVAVAAAVGIREKATTTRRKNRCSEKDEAEWDRAGDVGRAEGVDRGREGKEAAAWAGPLPRVPAVTASARNAGRRNPMNVPYPALRANARSAGPR